MLKIRLQRTGRKNVPTFRIVLTDSKNSTKSGKYLEILGNHDARTDAGDVKKDRVLHWMAQGAQLSDTLHNMFINKKIISGKKINVLPKKTPVIDEAKVAAEKAEAEAKVKAEADARAAAEAAQIAEVAAAAAAEKATADAAEAAKAAAEAPAPEVVAEAAPEVVAEAPVEAAPAEAPAAEETPAA